jgi:hypothetical protein
MSIPAHMITGPILATMKDHVVALGDLPFEFHTLAGVIASGFLEIRDEPFLAISDTRIMYCSPAYRSIASRGRH